MIQLPPDFKEFLRLLNSKGVEYLLVGGYAVGYHGYPRTTGDMDVWIAAHRENADRVIAALREFGFSDPAANVELFTTPDRVVRMGVPPMRIELLTSVSGVEFESCYRHRIMADIDGVPIPVICPDDLRANKKAAGRAKDMDDLEHLP